ncbi:MAG: TerB N-terminal domain-containing protein [Coriobacteriales bacterium]|nr:TerB N-terminal domain-containing protein [Coriobacteriales bacterium]
MTRAQDIVDDILGSDRYTNSKVFSNRVFADEPILRAGLRPRSNVPAGDERVSAVDPAPRAASRMPQAYRKLRALGRKYGYGGWGSPYALNAGRLFYEQGKLMEDFEDDFEGSCEFARYFPTYHEMSDYELRCYFSWRTRLRAGETPPAPTSFLFVHAYELLCGIGVEAGRQGYEVLSDFARRYAGSSPTFDAHLLRWSHDYVVFHGLEPSLIVAQPGSFSFAGVGTLRQAQDALLGGAGGGTWPESGPLPQGLPDPQDLLDALCSLSRYRAERSRFVKAHRQDVAHVCARVFARMVAHCHKRRKTDYVEGLFGTPTRVSYTMFPSAVFWSERPHEDMRFAVSAWEAYVCERGFWWRELPCRRTETSRELGSLLHAIDCRMRVATGDAHALKPRPLPKYQGKFVDEEIAALLELRAAQEAARVTIDWSSLGGIRSASVRMREALLTDEERADEVPVPESNKAVEPEPPIEVASAGAGAPSESALGLDATQLSLLRALLGEEPMPVDGGALFLSLAVDAINEAFLDIVGDTVIEYEGDMPVLVADYEPDVRDALS